MTGKLYLSRKFQLDQRQLEINLLVKLENFPVSEFYCSSFFSLPYR